MKTSSKQPLHTILNSISASARMATRHGSKVPGQKDGNWWSRLVASKASHVAETNCLVHVSIHADCINIALWGIYHSLDHRLTELWLLDYYGREEIHFDWIQNYAESKDPQAWCQCMETTKVTSPRSCHMSAVMDSDYKFIYAKAFSNGAASHGQFFNYLLLWEILRMIHWTF